MQKTNFDSEVFREFVGLVGRLFYDDPCIVLLDFLAAEEAAFLETDLRKQLGWRESLIQQKLYLLEKHLIIVKESKDIKNRVVLWRINSKIYEAVLFRYQALLKHFNQTLKESNQTDEFECSQCGLQYTALDAASCLKESDNNLYCNKCDGSLQPSEHEASKKQAKEKYYKGVQQLLPLQNALEKMSKMVVPLFELKPKKSEVTEEPEQNYNLAEAETKTKVANPPQQEARSIPWFDVSKAPASSVTPTKPIEFNIEIKPVNISATTPATATPKTFPKFTLPTKAPLSFGISRPSESVGAQMPVNLNSPAKSTNSYSKLIKDQSVYVKKLDCFVPFSEVTEETEQIMTDDEYAAFYNASDSLL